MPIMPKAINSHTGIIPKRKELVDILLNGLWKILICLLEATSAARLMLFDRYNVKKFYDAFRKLKQKYSFQPYQIYNLDKTSISIVATKNPKIITPREKRRVVKISSAEKGTNVTVLHECNRVVYSAFLNFFQG